MTAPARVKFHITEAGPKKCVAVLACPIGSSEVHYDNYLEAVRAYEKELAAVNSSFDSLSKSVPGLTYEDLLVPQEQDIEDGAARVYDFLYYGHGVLENELKDFHPELRFARNFERFVSVPEKEHQEVLALRAEYDGANEEQSRTLDSAIDRIVGPYRGTETFQRYQEFLKEELSETPELDILASRYAEPLAQAKIFSRALRANIKIPAHISAEFEKVWNADEFTPGSKLYTELELQKVSEKWKKLEESSNRELTANDLGFPNARQAERSFNFARRRLREYYRFRGRNNPATMKRVVEKLGLFQS